MNKKLVALLFIFNFYYPTVSFSSPIQGEVITSQNLIGLIQEIASWVKSGVNRFDQFEEKK